MFPALHDPAATAQGALSRPDIGRLAITSARVSQSISIGAIPQRTGSSTIGSACCDWLVLCQRPCAHSYQRAAIGRNSKRQDPEGVGIEAVQDMSIEVAHVNLVVHASRNEGFAVRHPRGCSDGVIVRRRNVLLTTGGEKEDGDVGVMGAKDHRVVR